MEKDGKISSTRYEIAPVNQIASLLALCTITRSLLFHSSRFVLYGAQSLHAGGIFDRAIAAANGTNDRSTR